VPAFEEMLVEETELLINVFTQGAELEDPKELTKNESCWNAWWMAIVGGNVLIVGGWFCTESAKILNPLFDPQKCSDMLNSLT
jgi:hypothetical protein